MKTGISIRDEILNSLSIKKPDLQRLREGDFDLSTKHIQSWIGSLPMGDSAELMRTCYRVLNFVNHYDYPVVQRHEFLEALHDKIIPAMASMQHLLAVEGYPVNERSYRVALLLNRMYSQLIIGYRILIHSSKAECWQSRLIKRRMLAKFYFRIFEYLGESACVFRLLQMPYPQDLWLYTYHVYNKSIEFKCLSYEFKDTLFTKAISVEQLFTRILFFSLLSPGSFRRDLLKSIHELLLDWGGSIKLEKEPNPLSSVKAIPLRFESGRPPTAMNDEENRQYKGQTIYLNVNSLFNNIERYATGNTTGIARINEKLKLPLDTLFMIKNQLEALTGIREERKEGTSKYLITIGFLAIHQAIKGDWRDKKRRAEIATKNEIIQEQKMREKELEEEVEQACATSVPGLEHTRSELDVWSMSFQGDLKVQKAALEEAKQKLHWSDHSHDVSIDPLRAREVNVSDGGFCISLSEPKSQRFRVGELLGVLKQGEGGWRLGEVRWLRNSNDGKWILGIKQIGVKCVPLHLVVQSGSTEWSKPINSILALEDDGGVLMYVPHFPGLNKKSIAIYFDGDLLPIELGNRIRSNTAFEAYRFISVSDLYENVSQTFDILASVLRSAEPAFESYDGVWVNTQHSLNKSFGT